MIDAHKGHTVTMSVHCLDCNETVARDVEVVRTTVHERPWWRRVLNSSWLPLAFIVAVIVADITNVYPDDASGDVSPAFEVVGYVVMGLVIIFILASLYAIHRMRKEINRVSNDS